MPCCKSASVKERVVTVTVQHAAILSHLKNFRSVDLMFPPIPPFPAGSRDWPSKSNHASVFLYLSHVGESRRGFLTWHFANVTLLVHLYTAGLCPLLGAQAAPWGVPASLTCHQACVLFPLATRSSSDGCDQRCEKSACLGLHGHFHPQVGCGFQFLNNFFFFKILGHVHAERMLQSYLSGLLKWQNF